MSNNTPIDETFRNAFDNFEADVNPQVWTNIEHHLPSAASPIAGNIASQTAKTLLTGSKFSLITYGIASSVIIAIVAVTYYFLKPAEKEIANTNSSNTTSTNPIVESKNTLPVNTLAADAKHENTLNSATANKKKAEPNISLPEEALKSSIDQNVSGDKTDNATAAQQSTDNEQHEINKDSEKATPPAITITEQNKIPPAADAKHENQKSQEPVTSTQDPASAKPSQSDDFEWGVIANVLSPNNDGKNDVFTITTPDLKSILAVIYDRNGNIVYKWNQLDGSWDGKDLKGKELPKGIYLYYIFAEMPEGKFHSAKGTITLFR